MLKADFHIHTKEDSHERWIRYNSKELIDRAAKKGFDVLAITLHGKFHYNKKLADYAKKKNILLIPGIEAYVEGRHVVILNANKEAEKIKSIEDLKEYKKKNKNSFVLAPHPFYPRVNCLGNLLLKNIELFDGIEYCHYYCRGYNPYNKKAVKTAKKYRKPVIGTSDAHRKMQFNKTYSFVDSKKDIKSVIKALKQGKVKVKTKPLSYFNCSQIAFFMIMNKIERTLFK